MPESKTKSFKKLTHAERGRLGGLATRGVTSKAKARAARENGKLGGKLGGRPRKYATASERQRAYIERKRKREGYVPRPKGRPRKKVVDPTDN